MKLNGSRKRAFVDGLATLRQSTSSKMLPGAATIGEIRPRLYNRSGMPTTNQIITGDSIKVLNDGPEGWVDLAFADPPFNIGYLYSGYNDRKDGEEYVHW